MNNNAISEQFHLDIRTETLNAVLYWGPISAAQKYEMAKRIYNKSYLSKISETELENYNPVRLDEQRILNAFKKDLTTH